MKAKTFAIAAILALVISLSATIAGTAASGPAPLVEAQQVTFGGNITVPAGQTQQDVVVFGGSVLVDGTVSNDVVAIGGSVVINGTVGHDVAVVGGTLTLGPHSSVGHDVNIVGGTLNRAEGAQVGGNVVYGRRDGVGRVFVPGVTRVGVRGGDFAFFRFLNVVGGIVTAIGIILLGLLLLLFFPRQLEVTSSVVERRWLETFALGVGGLLAGIFLAVLFGITIIFLPVSFLIAVAMAAGWVFGWAALFLLTGQRLLRATNRAQDLVPALLLGGILWGILANIPILKFLVILLGGSLALGAAILSRFGTQGPGAPLLAPVTSSAPAPPSPPATA